jgi:hypothetical protein
MGNLEFYNVPLVQTTVKVPPDLFEKFKDLCKRAGYSFDQLMSMALQREICGQELAAPAAQDDLSNDAF